MHSTTLDDLLGDFAEAAADARDPAVKNGTTLTLWVPVELKARYDRLQERSGRRFSQKARETIEALIDTAEAKVG